MRRNTLLGCFFCEVKADRSIRVLFGFKRSLPHFVSSCSGRDSDHFTFHGTQRACSVQKFQCLPFLNAHFRFSCSAAVGRSSSRFRISSEHKKRVQMKSFQRLSDLNAHFRFSCLAAVGRLSVTSPFNLNTKTVFILKGSSLAESKRPLPLFLFSCSGQVLESLQDFIRTQKACSNEILPALVGP